MVWAQICFSNCNFSRVLQEAKQKPDVVILGAATVSRINERSFHVRQKQDGGLSYVNLDPTH